MPIQKKYWTACLSSETVKVYHLRRLKTATKKVFVNRLQQ